MTNGEANSVFVLLRWIFGPDRWLGDHAVSDDQAIGAAACLADRAYKTLSAGAPGDRVRELWTERRPVVVHDHVPPLEIVPESLYAAFADPAVKALVRDLLDGVPCEYDHGQCVTHAWQAFKTGRRCPHERARDLLGGGDA